MFSPSKAAEMINNLAQNNVCYIMLIGSPGSGKTDFVVKYLDVDKYKTVSLGDIKKELITESAILISDAYELASREAKIEAINHLDSGHNVIYDAVNCYPKVRNIHLNAVKHHCDLKIGIVVNQSLISCYKKASNDIPEMKLESMYLNIKKMPPSLNEGFDILMEVNMRNIEE